jgi:hypothetical protein
MRGSPASKRVCGAITTSGIGRDLTVRSGADGNEPIIGARSAAQSC